jgi:hypothetical protein
VVGAKKLHGIRAEGGCASRARGREPRMAVPGHFQILARKYDPAKLRIVHRKEVDVL